MKKIDQIYHPYWLWEDQKKYYPSDRQVGGNINNAKKLLTDCKEFYHVAKEMLCQYKFAQEHNLSNSNLNRIQWIGQQSCFYKYGCKEEETRAQWKTISEEQRKNQNDVAQRCLNEWLDTKTK